MKKIMNNYDDYFLFKVYYFFFVFNNLYIKRIYKF